MNPVNQPETLQTGLVAVVLGIAVTFMLFSASMAVPALGLLSGIMAPFPVIYNRIRFGRLAAIIMTIGVLALLSGVFGFSAGLVYLLQCGVISLALPEFLARSYGAARSIAWTTALNAVILAAAAFFFASIASQDIHKAISNEITTGISHAVKLYENSGVKGEDLQIVKQSMEIAASLIARIYPALATILLLMVAGFNLAMLRHPVFNLAERLQLGQFKEFRSPEWLVWLLIAAGFAMLAPDSIITTPALNILVLLSVIYFLQGFAVILTFVGRMAFAGVMRVILCIMLILQPYLSAIVTTLGIFDLWGDFRTPKNQENL